MKRSGKHSIFAGPGKSLLLLSLVLLLSFVLQINISLQNPVPDYDEAIYFNVIRNVSQSGLPLRTSSGNLFAVHPCGYFYPAGMLYHLGLDTVFLQRSLQSLLSLLLIGIVYQLCGGRGKPVALMSAGLLAINPFFLHYAHSLYLELPETFWCYLSILFWSWGERSKSFRWERYALCGFALGIGALTKYHSISLGVAFGVYYMVQCGGRIWKSKPFWILFACSLSVFLFWPVFAWMLIGREGILQVVRNRPALWVEPTASDPRTMLSRFDIFLQTVKAMGPLFSLSLALALLGEIKEQWKEKIYRLDGDRYQRQRFLLMLWIFIYGGLLILLGLRDYKYYYLLLPALTLLFSIRAVAAFSWINQNRPGVRYRLIGGIFVWFILIFPVDLTGIDRVPILQKLYFTEQDYTWRAYPHHVNFPKMCRTISRIAHPGERILVGKHGPIVCAYTELPYRMTYLSGSVEIAQQYLDEHRIFLIDGPMEHLFPKLSHRERQGLAERIETDWKLIEQAGDMRLMRKKTFRS